MNANVAEKTAGQTAENSAEAAEQAAEAFTETPLFEGLARAGYRRSWRHLRDDRVLAIRLADGVAAPRPNQQGAMHQIAQQQFGHLLLLLIGHRSRRLRALAARAGARRAHARIRRAQQARPHRRRRERGRLRRVLPARDQRASRHGQQLVQPDQEDDGRRPAWPAGRELVGAAGLLFIGIGIYQAYLGLSKKFLEYSKTGQMSRYHAAGVHAVGVVGLVARAVAFALIGIFVLKAAVDYTPRDAVGIDGALARLPSTPTARPAPSSWLRRG